METIGSRLRSARMERGVSLRSVAQQLGVSASLISQVETDKTRPSVATLYSMATLLGISLDDLLGLEPQELPEDHEPSQQLTVQRADRRRVLDMEAGVRWEALVGAGDGPANAILVTYDAGASSSREGSLMVHTGIEYAHILEGNLTLEVEGREPIVLGPGDTLQLDSTLPHRFSNQTDAPAQGIWFIVGRKNGESPYPTH